MSIILSKTRIWHLIDILGPKLYGKHHIKVKQGGLFIETTCYFQSSRLFLCRSFVSNDLSDRLWRLFPKMFPPIENRHSRMVKRNFQPCFFVSYVSKRKVSFALQRYFYRSLIPFENGLLRIGEEQRQSN